LLFRINDARSDASMLLKVVQKPTAIDQLNGLAPDEIVSIGAVGARGYQNAFVRAFMIHGAKQVPHRGYANSMAIALGLNHNLSSDKGTHIESDYIHTTVAGRARLLRRET